VRKHGSVDVVLPALRPLAVVLSNNRRAVPQDVRWQFERGAIRQKPGGQRVPVAVRVGILHARFLKHRRQRSLGDSHDRSLSRVPVP
jgi:hypothetical protein